MRRKPRWKLVAVLVLLAACDTGTEPELEPSFLEDPPTSLGPIVALDVSMSIPGAYPTVHVRASGDECGVIYAVHDDTPIKRKSDRGEFVDVAVEDLRKGMNVAVWTDIILTSCPGQASAHAIEVF